MKRIKNFLRNNCFFLFYYIERGSLYIRFFVDFVKCLKKESIKEYPDTIQLPITYKCNFDCKMCGMRKLISQDDFDYIELKEIINDKLFCNISSVGLNGGEPFIKNDLVECVQVLIDGLPKLKQISIISNGYFTDKIIEKLSAIYKICKKNNVRIHVSFSVDGIRDMQDYMRGKGQSWKNVNNTLDRIRMNPDLFCDDMNIICTLTKYNIYRVEEVECWAKNRKINVAYNIATINERIDNGDKYSDFTILNDEKAKEMAKEFFLKKSITEKSKRYYALYLYLAYGRRYATCPCQYNNWVTLTPDGAISYCATHSKLLGSSLHTSAYELFNGNINYLNDIKSNYCDTCSHYIGRLNRNGICMYYKELLNEQKVLF